jgi:hypothetical protein
VHCPPLREPDQGRLHRSAQDRDGKRQPDPCVWLEKNQPVMAKVSPSPTISPNAFAPVQRSQSLFLDIYPFPVFLLRVIRPPGSYFMPVLMISAGFPYEFH